MTCVLATQPANVLGSHMQKTEEPLPHPPDPPTSNLLPAHKPQLLPASKMVGLSEGHDLGSLTPNHHLFKPLNK